MSEVQHAPGPWWETDTGIRDKGGHICFTPSAFHYPDQRERFEKETAERAANKTLIAAAPELLEALIDVRRALVIANFTGELAVVDAAIAKATGQPA